MQTTLFDHQQPNRPHDPAQTAPLAHRLRPQSFSHFYGQQAVFARHPFLLPGPLPSLVLYGPCGSGKTTLARLLARHHGLEFYAFQAVLSGVGELKKLIQRAQEVHRPPASSPPTPFAIFIDEIHRFNRAQQDALLPYVEAGDFVLLGATTQNPLVCVNRALLSRLQILELQALEPPAIAQILQRAAQELKQDFPPDILQLLANYCAGDARKALNTLELVSKHFQQLPDRQAVWELIQANSKHYDRTHDRHYDVISAFIKSLRGSDCDAALLWLAVMLSGGEDPLFIARRLVIFASEDIGNADPQALSTAVNTLLAVEKIGMPEARIILAQATTSLAASAKSNASYLAIERAMDYVKKQPNIEVPSHLRNQHPDRCHYLYPHNFPQHWVKQDYAPKKMAFYQPTEQGREKLLQQSLERIKRASAEGGSMNKQRPSPARASGQQELT